jgi:sugar lactone lactonase YvrE
MKAKLTPGWPLIVAFLLVCFLTNCKKNEQENTPKFNVQKTALSANKSPVNFNKAIINTFAGGDIRGYSGDGGPVGSALLNSPENVYVSKKGDVYITDFGNHVIRKVDGKTGIISTIAGNGSVGFSGDGGPATQASLKYAFHTATDDLGNLYISDLDNNRIRRVEKSTGIIQTIAGTGVDGFNGDGKTALATDIYKPFGLAFDKEGNLLFSDQNGLCLRKMNMKTKIITTVAGNRNRGYGGDGGPATEAMFDLIWNVAVDNVHGDIYVSDINNVRIRKIDPSTGIITTAAGNGVYGNSGMGGLATNASFNQPVGVAVDKNGNLFIGDQLLSQVYVVDKKTGIINLIAGNGTNGFYGDGGPAVLSILSWTNSLSVDQNGVLYISDVNNNRVRKITGLSN